MPRSPRLNIQYRHVVLAASLLMLMAGQGGAYILVVSLKDIAASFNWPRTVPSLAYSLQFIGAGVGGILMGHLLDRSGMGKPALIGALMIGSGAIMASRLQSQWELYLIYGVMIGLLGQATLFSPLMANVTRWFEQRRGTAVGIVASGQTLAGTVWPPIFSHFNQTIGWRDTFFWYGVFAILVMLPLSLVFRRRAPGDAPNARPAPSAADAPSPGRAPGETTVATTLSPGATLVLLCVAIVGCCIAMSLPLAHIVAHASDLGHSPTHAAGMLAVMLLASSFARIFGVGYLSERHGGLGALFIFSGAQAATLALFLVVDGLTGLYVLAVAFGLGYAGVIPCYAIATREHLPHHRTGRDTAIVILFGAIGMAAGSALGGAMYDLTGSYDPAFLIGLAFNHANLVVVGVLIYRTGNRPPRTAAA